MSKKVPCPKCGRLNELSFGTCDCSGCHQRYGLCKKCGKIFDASGGLSATCPDCRDEAAAVDSDGTFVGWLDAKIMNSNHNLEMHLLRLFVAIPLLKPMKLRRRGGFAWWFGTLWLTFYVGVILFIIASYGLKTGGAHPDLCSGIMGWGTAFILFLAPKLISVMIRGGSKKIKIMTISVLMLDITAVVLAYMFSIGSWTAPSMLIDSRDGKSYRTVKIGDQIWMAENLNYETENSYCYDNTPDNCTKYGRLYSWAAALSACPSGWHLPDTTEWCTLFNTVGGSSMAPQMLKSTEGWGNNGGIDAFGFSVLPAGGLFYETDPFSRDRESSFSGVGEFMTFWSSTNYDNSQSPFYINFEPYYGAIPNNDMSDWDDGLSVRCLKD